MMVPTLIDLLLTLPEALLGQLPARDRWGDRRLLRSTPVLPAQLGLRLARPRPLCCPRPPQVPAGLLLHHSARPQCAGAVGGPHRLCGLR